MKKALLSILFIAFIFSCIVVQAQQHREGFVAVKKKLVHPGYMQDYSNTSIGQKYYDNTVIGTTWYDAQAINYGNIMQRVWAYDDGSIGAAWTCAGENLIPDRGIGYNYYNGTEWGTPDLHIGVGDDVRLGTTCYAPYGENGEIACSYQYIAGESPIRFFAREIKGEGDWVELGSAVAEAGVSLVWQAMTTSGENNEYIHLLAYTYDQEVQGQENALLYFRSNDGGETWDPDGIIIDGLGISDVLSINALSYNWSNSVGNTIAFTYGFDQWGGWVFKSDDNGDSWEQITVMESPFDPFDPPTDTDVFGLGIGSSSVALDSEGKAHVVFPRMLQLWEDGEWGYYPLNTDGLVYWNEDMNPLDTTIISSTGLENLEADGYLCGYIFGYDPSVGVEIPEGQPNYANALCGYPVISIDESDNIFISWSAPTPGYISGEGYLYRHIIANSSFDGGMTWNGMIDLNDDIQFIFSECAFPAMAPVVDNSIYFLFQEDSYPGTYEWPGEQPEAVENRMFMMTVPKSVFVGIEENEGALDFEVSELYPNPASTSLNFVVRLQENSKVHLALLNMMGQSVIHLDKGNMNAGDHKLLLDISELSPGIYTCQVNVNGQSLSKKVIVQ